jgi:hypothetical protein
MQAEKSWSRRINKVSCQGGNKLERMRSARLDAEEQRIHLEETKKRVITKEKIQMKWMRGQESGGRLEGEIL